MMDRRTDAELVAAFQSGDEGAFEAIYRRYAPRLCRYIERRCGSQEWAEELVQEAMLKAARHIPHGAIYDLNSYLVLCVREMWWRRAEQARRRPDERHLDPHSYNGHAGFVEDIVLERETIREVAVLISRLGEFDHAVAALKLLGGYDLPGVAELLGVSTSSARNAWRRASRKLQAWSGGKRAYAALEQALISSAWPEAVPLDSQCRVPGCARPRHALERCAHHAEELLARRRQLLSARQARSRA